MTAVENDDVESVPPERDVPSDAHRIAQLETELASARERLAWALAELADAATAVRHSREHAETSSRRSHLLASLYDVACRLHLAPDRAELVLAIGQLVRTHLGLGGWALFSLERGAETLSLAAHAGIPARPWLAVRVGEGAVGRVAAHGKRVVHVRSGAPRTPFDEALLVACFPLRLGSETTGALAVFRAPDDDRVPTSDELIVLDAIALHAAPLLTAPRSSPPPPERTSETRRPPKRR